MKKLYLLSTILLMVFVFVYSCSAEEEDTSPPPALVQPQEPEPDPTQYTLTVSAGEGGTVSTEGGTYDEGTEVTITATPDEGYEFVGWEGSDSDSNSLTVTLNGDTTVQALFAQLPVLILPSLPSKMFTKGVADTLSIGFTSSAGFKRVGLVANYGTVEVLEQPEEGANEGNIVVRYTPQSIENVDYMTTIAGYDELVIALTSVENVQNNYSYNIRTQPEPIYKDYLKPSHDLVKTRAKINPALIRFINQKDNSQEDRCLYENGGLNQFGNLSDEYGGIAFADVNGDGYDDMFIHPHYSEGSATNFTLYKVKFELYLYENGEYVFYDINSGNESILEAHLSRKILVGDFDNDGDPDFYAANFGIDGGNYETEKSFFIVNNFNIDGTFSYVENPHMEGSHEATSADIDKDGDLDIYSHGRGAISQPSSPFYENIGNFNLRMWSGYTPEENIIINPDSDQYDWQYSYFSRYITSDLVDINEDGFVDLLLSAHEWEKEPIILWGSNSGFNTSDKSVIPQVANPASFAMGVPLDFKVADLDYDGTNEIILLRSGGDANSGGTDIGYFYSGWYLQILDTIDKEIVDITDNIIETYFSDTQEQYCANPANNWIMWISIDDYDNDGNIDIFNKMMSNRPLHRWEWNGSKYIKINP